jgi:hypothetical protein
MIWVMVLSVPLSVLAMLGDVAPARAQDCLAAATQAEQQYEIPPGLLAAIGRVESGRRDPLSGRVAPWPWTIDTAGTGAFLPGPAEAVASVRALQLQGIRNIDVGCFQVNLAQHPDAFTSLEQALDPPANARYAARFLADLHHRFGNWPAAVMNYHSATPELGMPYRDRVLANWNGADTPLPMFGMVIWTPGPVAPAVIQIGPVAAKLPHIIGPGAAAAVR